MKPDPGSEKSGLHFEFSSRMQQGTKVRVGDTDFSPGPITSEPRANGHSLIVLTPRSLGPGAAGGSAHLALDCFVFIFPQPERKTGAEVPSNPSLSVNVIKCNECVVC